MATAIGLKIEDMIGNKIIAQVRNPGIISSILVPKVFASILDHYIKEYLIKNKRKISINIWIKREAPSKK